MPFTESEATLARLAQTTFLSLWSHPNPHRPTAHVERGGDGKEVCDLLAVLGDDVIVFSDKKCELRLEAGVETGWRRWYRRAVQNSLKQLSGAVRLLVDRPGQVFRDKKCTESLAWMIPPRERARYHRVLVANGARDACIATVGGRGTLGITPTTPADKCPPFFLPRLDQFAHVFDETGLELVLKELDTMADFVGYLRAREALWTSGRLLAAAGEEDLLATYLKTTDATGQHCFPGGTSLLILDGAWGGFERSAARANRNKANRDSYLWDRLIEHAASTVDRVTTPSGPSPTVQPHERELPLRAMASEGRLARRALADAWLGFIRSGKVGFRSAFGLDSPERVYVFHVHPRDFERAYEESRQARSNALVNYVMMLCHRDPKVKEVVGISFDQAFPDLGGSEDFLYYKPGGPLDQDVVDNLEAFRSALGLLDGATRREVNFQEFPERDPRAAGSPHDRTGTREGARSRRPRASRTGPNDRCPCGSGRKYKRCHGAPHRR